MTHMVTIKDLETRGDNTYYTGPLEEAKAFIRAYANVSVFSRPGQTIGVYFNHDGDDANPDNCNEFGKAPTEEEAWRLALGAAFGPADDEFSAFPLTTNNALAVRTLVNHHFPEDKRQDVLYSTTGPNAVVVDEIGALWHVYPDGTLKVYRG